MRFTKIFSKIILSLTLMFAFCLPCLNNVKAATSYDVIFRAGAHGSFNGESIADWKEKKVRISTERVTFYKF